MKIIYTSCLSENEYIKEVLGENPKQFGHQVQKYHKLIVQGLVSNTGVEVVTISALPVNSSICNKKFLSKKTVVKNNIKYNHLSTVNLPIIKQLHTLVTSFFEVCKIKKQKDIFMIADVLNISLVMGTLLACKLRKIKTVGIVTDVPCFFANEKPSFAEKINSLVMKKFDSYLLLTEAMNEVVNLKNKPYIVIEGQVDVNMVNMQNVLKNKYNEKVCIYAGSLKKIYGIKYLTEAFIKANVENSELHIYGDGDFKEELLEICMNNSSVKYFGSKPNEYVVKEELKATLLINPRPTNEEYTKYSFPSKNMEYMVSGTPILTTKLSGMPKEYYDYVYLIEKENVDDLAVYLKELLNKPKEELYTFGEKAKQFVINEKNNVFQSKRIIEFLEV